MSERSKGDTSSSLAAPPASARVVKNPLLSASVTGLTFDDFQNKPLLLPAAPPILHPVPIVSSRESTPLVTVGKSTDIDSENLSEINLNDVSATSSSSAANTSDENSNTLLEPSIPPDNSILSQAASSFSQLPSVASSVFSTFSKKFNSSTGRDDINANPPPQLNIQPFAAQYQSPSVPPPPSDFENQEDEESESSQIEPKLPVAPPTFYSPADIPSVPSGIPGPPIPSGQNTYRISAKKKIYAPIPGLSSTHQEQNSPTVPAPFPPPFSLESSAPPEYIDHSVNKPEERKGGLFSLSNLVPAVPNVFQNLSGLVQSAAGSLSQKTEQHSQPQPQTQPIDSFGSFQIETHGPGPSTVFPTNTVNFFGDQSAQPLVYQPPPPVNLFGPPVPGIAQPPQQASPHQAPPHQAPPQLAPPQQVPLPPTSSFGLNSNAPRPPIQVKPVSNVYPDVPQQSATVNPPQEVPRPPSNSGVQQSDQPPTFGGFFPGNNTIPQSASPGPQQTPVAPPPAKPPSGGPVSTSFRLQKGTRLYKSPFTVGTSEYQPHPVYGFPPAPQSIIPLSQSTAEVFSHFNPFQQGSLTTQGSVPLQGASQGSVTPQGSIAPQGSVAGFVAPQLFVPPQGSVPLQGSVPPQGSVAPQQSVEPNVSIAPPGSVAPQLFVPPQGSVPLQESLKTQESVPLQGSVAPQTSIAAPGSVAALPLQRSFPPQGSVSPQGSVPPQGFAVTQESIPPLPPGSDSVQAPTFQPPAEKSAENSVSDGVTPAATLDVTPREEEQTNTFPTIFPSNRAESRGEITSHSTSAEEARITTELHELPKEDVFTNKPSNSSETDLLSRKEIVSVAQDLIQEQLKLGQSNLLPPHQDLVKEQLKLGQSNLLPPPPAIGSGIEVPSKETANFPPPPPQHSFQNKPSSNPYRKGLQPHHTPLPPPTSLSAIFTPTGQDFPNIFKPSAVESENPTLEGPSPVASFFTQPSEILGQPPKAVTPSATNEAAAVTEELTAFILSAPARELSNVSFLNKSPEKEIPLPEIPSAHITEEAAERFNPVPATTPPLRNLLPGDEITLTTQPAAVSSFFAKAVEVVQKSDPTTNPLKKDTEDENRPSTGFVNFFKADPLPIETFVSKKIESALETSKPGQLERPVPTEGVKIASPIKPQENPEPQQLPNLFSNFFQPESSAAVIPAVSQQSLPDPTSFFDSFAQVPSVGVDAPPTEDPNSQRIQNFFNNPPPKDLDPVGDLNYNLVGSGLSVKNQQTRSLTPASNLAEPPSSSCSDFSELNSSLSAANKQPRTAAEDSTKVSPEEEIAYDASNIYGLSEEVLNELKMSSSSLETSNASFPINVVYKPAVKHWFYKRKLDAKQVWTPFSYFDSALLEKALALGDNGPNLVAVEGGRYDVNISERVKVPIYWEGEPIEVKRCSWFYKASDSKYVPYEEEIADLLEEEYRKAAETGEWHKKIPISAGDMVVFHGPTVIVLFQQQQQVDSWGGSTQTTTRPRVVKRDLDDFTIDEGESHKVDHLLFMVHGIGSACDLKMRSVEEVVDEFRSIALQLVQSHYKNSVENGFVGRVEVLPVSWHSELHSDELGIDEKLKSITLESIPKLRNFTNDTLLDILFYTSPMFCQRIMNTVTASMNSVFVKYKQRNPDFRGGVSLAGHSLGSLILFDLLCHQRPIKECEEQNMENPDEFTPGYPVDSNQLNEDAAKHISYKMGPAGTGQPFISYPQLLFQPKKFFALGSPIGMFVTIRGIDKLGLDFRLPTCPGFYNIFHPYDPVAYRLEALVNPDMNGIPPVLIPHHKGRKRMHLELKETMTRVGADLKQRFFDTFKTTFDSVSFLAPKTKNEQKDMEKEVDKVLEMQTSQEKQAQHGASTSRSRADSNSTNQSDTDIIEIDFPLGKLNDSKRVDYVLQEAPLEFFNEYLFALSSHVCYWESEDTILFVMKEIYSGIGFSPDSQVPQQTMTIERPSPSGALLSQQGLS